jgi:hypothetical protein
MSAEADVLKIKEQNKEALLAKANVVGVGTGYKKAAGKDTAELCVIALVSRKKPLAALSADALIPVELDGVLTDVIEIGFPRAQQARTDKCRPAPGGVSIGHYQITAGTLGCIVRDLTTKQRLILSNNHVLANVNAAQLGDAILQQGAIDGGDVNTCTIAHLERYAPINFGTQPASCNIAKSVADILNAMAGLLGSSHQLQAVKKDVQATNLVDAAAARPVDDSQVLDEILEIGVVSGVKPVTFGMTVRKSGRTTGLTTGTVSVLNATVNVDYDEGRTARFEDQVITTPMSQGGDSGSLIVAGDTLEAVGLLFAGSDQSTIFNPIQTVLNTLKVTL